MLGYLYSLDGVANTPHARAMAMLALIMAGATVTIALSGMRSMAARRIVVASLGSAAVLVQVPAFAAMLHLSPLHADDLTLATGLGALAGAPAFLLRRRRRLPYSR